MDATNRTLRSIERAAAWSSAALLPLAGALAIWAGQVLGTLLRWAFSPEQRPYAFAFCATFLLCVAVFVGLGWAFFGAAAIFIGWTVATQADAAQ